MFENFNFWEFLAGLGIFLFGIFLLEESIKHLAGVAFKRLIRKYTATHIRAVSSGAFATAILQSSTAVSMMVLAFVGSGIMQIGNAIGVVIGSSLGTTMTSWIVATIGFKVNIESISLPFIAIGGLGLIFFGKSTRATNISKLLVGFGFLFMGLDYMKSSINELANMIDLAQFKDTNIFVFLLIGFILTALIQSSSATMAIALTAVNSGLIDLEMGAALVIGASVGTTTTVLLGSIGGVSAKKQVAYSHFFFNLSSAIIGFILLPVLIFFIRDIMGFKTEIVIGLAIFHSLFIFIGVLLFFPIIKQFAKFITWLTPIENKTEAKFLSVSALEIPEAAIESLVNETIRIIRFVMLYNLRIMKIDPKLIFGLDVIPMENSMKTESIKIYEKIKILQDEIFTYSAQIQSQSVSKEEADRLLHILHSVRNAVIAAKTIKDITHELEIMEGSDNDFIRNKYDEFRKKLMNMYVSLEQILIENEVEKIISGLFNINRRNYLEDKNYLLNATEAIAKKKVPEGQISSILTINRGFVFSYNQLINSIKEVKLTEEHIVILDDLNWKDENK